MIGIFNKLFQKNTCTKKVVIQTEVTGFAPEDGNKLVEITAIEIDENDIQTGAVFHAYINPDCDMPEEVIKIHGLDNEFLKKYPTFEFYKNEFLHFIASKEIIGHNVQFDLKFLNNELGFELQNKITDTLEMARKVFPNQKNNLNSLCERLDIKILHSPYNGALLNALYMLEVYKELKGGV